MSYESRCIMPRRAIRAAIKAYARKRAAYELIAREAMEEAALGLLQVHGRHVSGYCAAMGSACFYARYRWFDKKTQGRWPITVSSDDNIPVTVQRAIAKWERDFLTPYTAAFGYDFTPLRATAELRMVQRIAVVVVTTQRDW